jgi:hypothetical protein
VDKLTDACHAKILVRCRAKIVEKIRVFGVVMSGVLIEFEDEEGKEVDVSSVEMSAKDVHALAKKSDYWGQLVKDATMDSKSALIPPELTAVLPTHVADSNDVDEIVRLTFRNMLHDDHKAAPVKPLRLGLAIALSRFWQVENKIVEHLVDRLISIVRRMAPNKASKLISKLERFELDDVAQLATKHYIVDFLINTGNKLWLQASVVHPTTGQSFVDYIVENVAPDHILERINDSTFFPHFKNMWDSHIRNIINVSSSSSSSESDHDDNGDRNYNNDRNQAQQHDAEADKSEDNNSDVSEDQGDSEDDQQPQRHRRG